MGGKLAIQLGRESQMNKTRSRPAARKNWFTKRGLLPGFLFTLNVLMWGGTAFGHHGGAAWDSKTTITLQGTVTEFRFINPHAQIFFDSKDDNGNMIHWSCEAADPSMLVRQGWNRQILKPGDQVKFVGHPAKSGAKLIELQKLTLPNGEELTASGSGQ